MPVATMENVLGSYLLNSGNFVNNSIIDSSKYANHMPLINGTPVWDTQAGIEGVKLDGNFWFELDKYPLVPYGSTIRIMHIDPISQGEGVMAASTVFKGDVVTGDHIASSYDPSTDIFNSSNRDKQDILYGNSYRFSDNGGANAILTIPATTWSIVITVNRPFPAQMQASLNGGTPNIVTEPNGFLYNTVGTRFRLGELNLSGTAPTAGHIIYSEIHFFGGDVTQQAGFADLIAELKTAYSIV